MKKSGNTIWRHVTCTDARIIYFQARDWSVVANTALSLVEIWNRSSHTRPGPYLPWLSIIMKNITNLHVFVCCLHPSYKQVVNSRKFYRYKNLSKTPLWSLVNKPAIKLQTDMFGHLLFQSFLAQRALILNQRMFSLIRGTSLLIFLMNNSNVF